MFLWNNRGPSLQERAEELMTITRDRGFRAQARAARGVLRFALFGAQALVCSLALALEGRVVDKQNGHPIANVEVSVVGGSQMARSDADGRFLLIPDPKPPFELLVVLPGGLYMKPIHFEQIPDGAPILVEIAATAEELVTVTAGAAPGIQSAPANGTTLISRDDLRTRASRNLTQTMENVAGVSSVSEGQAAVPAFRGLAQARSLILIDGARVTAERRVGPSATYLDPFVLEDLEVSRGPGAVAYGSDAFGGVILARTRRPEPGGDLKFAFTGSLGAGVPQGRAGFEVESGITESSGALFSGHYRGFSDYDSPEGEVFNSGSRDYGFLTRYAQVLEGGVLSIGIQGDYGRDIERPRTNSDVVRFYYPNEDSLRLTASYEGGPALGLDEMEVTFFLGGYELVTDQDQFETATDPRLIERADVSARDFGVRAAGGDHWGQTRFEFGVDVNGRFDLEAQDIVIMYDLSGNQTSYDSMTTIEDARRLDTGVFVTATGALTSVFSLAGGLRYDWVASTNEGGFFGDTSADNAEPSGFVAATLGSFSGFSTTLQYARGFRDARLSDRYFRGVTGAGFITGNPDLDPETSDQYDLALRYTARHWRSAMYLYHYEIDDLIERFEDPNQADFFFFRNHGEARIRGVEVEVQADLPHRFSLQFAGNLSEGESLEDGSALDDIQPSGVAVQLRKELGERCFAQIRGAWYGDRDEPGPTEVAVDDHTVVDVAGGWRVAENFALELLVRNLLDETYALSPDGRSPPAPGITGILTANVTF